MSTQQEAPAGPSPEAAVPAPVHTSSYWEQRYQEGRTGWDLGGPTPLFVDVLKQASDGALQPLPPGRILVVGCGRGHDVLLFARYGFDALGVDFAPSAVQAGMAAAQAARLVERARFLEANMFDLPQQYPSHFDYVLERACYCAVDPGDRRRYVAAVAALLKPGGRVLGQFFLGPQRRPGPPFATSVEEIRMFFADSFEVEHVGDPHSGGSLPGADALVILRRR